MRSLPSVLALTFTASISACDPPPSVPQVPAAPPAAPAVNPRMPSEAVPALELPRDVRAVRERLELFVDPDAPTFHGVADIEITLDRPRDVVWLHGLGLRVSRVEALAGATPVAGQWKEAEQAHPSGVARVSFDTPLPPGHVTLHLEWEAPFVQGAKGLFVSKQAGVAYAATQFEAISARRAFPCFDEPAAKIPYEISLVVKSGDAAISNGRESRRDVLHDGHVRVHFAATPPLPSYLVAFAVGPYDVVPAADVPANAVRATPLPLRGVAPRGRGPELAYAMANAGAILTKLEEYFGVPYPYEKLDLLAIPDQLGAMENAAAITFSEDLLLFDSKTSNDNQRRSFGIVVAHEMAHQWFGDLVTMRWWNDIWLNEAFATWTAAKIGDAWNPSVRSRLQQLEGVQYAMGSDEKSSARAIRQPIETNDDIENGFDGITYQKGAGVIGMFERWVGEDAFRRGVRAHFEAHRFGSATGDDFLAAISAAAGKDVAPAFHSFLDKPGVPFVEVAVRCDGAPRLHVKQSRYLPIGSSADSKVTWQIPFCARYGGGAKGAPARETCALVSDAEADVPLEGACPEWVMPNAGARGYYRFALAPADLAKLRKFGLKELDVAERMAFGNSLRAAWSRATLPFGDILEAATALATDPNREVAGEPIGFLSTAHEWLAGDPARPKAQAYGRRLFGGVARDLGFEPKKGEEGGRAALRRDVLYFLADVAKDPGVRAELTKRGRAYFTDDGKLHPEAVSPDLATLALRVSVEGGDAKTFAALRAAFGKTENAIDRSRLLRALALIRAPEVAAQARALVLDPALRGNEILEPLWTQFGDPELRAEAWKWLMTSYDAIFARLKDTPFALVGLTNLPRGFCDETHADEVDAFFEPRAKDFDGGAREVASTVEEIRLCAKLRKAQEPSVRAFFK